MTCRHVGDGAKAKSRRALDFELREVELGIEDMHRRYTYVDFAELLGGPALG